MSDLKFQRAQVKKLRSQTPLCYEEAAIYTVLLDLVESNSLSEVMMMLHNVSSDLGKLKEFDEEAEKVKKMKWA